LGFEIAKVHQDFQTISTVVAYAFGGKKTQKKPEGRKPQNAEEAQLMLNNIFGVGMK
jgi:hypothetical protein